MHAYRLKPRWQSITSPQSLHLQFLINASDLQVSHYLMSVGGSKDQLDVCVYNSSGRLALAYAVGAFILLAVAMFAEHAYMLVAVAAPESASAGMAVAQDHPRVASTAAALTWQTGCLFFLTW